MTVELRHLVRAHLELAGVIPLPEQYAAKEGGPRWVTIGGSPETRPGGQHVEHAGGSRVQIDGKGNILKGASWATKDGATNVSTWEGTSHRQRSRRPLRIRLRLRPHPAHQPVEADAEDGGEALKR